MSYLNVIWISMSCTANDESDDHGEDSMLNVSRHKQIYIAR